MKTIYIFDLVLLMLFFLLGCKQQEPTAEKKLEIDDQYQAYWKKNTQVAKHVFDAGNIGFWGNTANALPTFHFTAPLPLETRLQDSTKIGYPTDPWFLMGNYCFNCFVHASGGYQILSMERAISRLNYAGSVHDYASSALISLNGNQYPLVGLNSPLATSGKTEKVFGCGFAVFNYEPVKNIKVSRKLAVLPSDEINKGHSAMLLKVTVKNKTNKALHFDYSETVTARYHMTVWNNPPFRKKRIHYLATPMEFYPESKTTGARFIYKEATPLVTSSRHEMALADGFPPSLILQAIDIAGVSSSVSQQQLDSASVQLRGTAKGVIPPGDEQTFCFAIGYKRDKGMDDWNRAYYALQENYDNDNADIPYQDVWRKRIPAFLKEDNESMRSEMQWHAAMLESMANYNEFYNETYIPQGNVYEYGVGVSAALCDHMMHSLPVAWYNPELAKSIMRFAMKHANFRGEIYASDEGCGRMPLGPASKSNSYTYFFMTMTEYLKATNNSDLLKEDIPFWGMPHTKTGTVLDRIERIFLFFRDEVSVGPHGLPRLLNSDWNDCFYFFFDNMSYHHIFSTAESHMNAAMAVKHLGELAGILEKMKAAGNLAGYEKRSESLIKAMNDYQQELFNTMVDDMGSRDFLSRAYIGDKVHVGEESLFLEPQVFALGIKEMPVERRKKMWQAIKERVWKMEKKGARQNEIPLGSNYEDALKGTRENGGFWFSLNGPMIVNLIDVNRDDAQKALYKITLQNHAEQFPNYWVGMWSGGDSFDSSLLPTEGLTNKYLFPFPVFCAHAHAWPLWGYLNIENTAD